MINNISCSNFIIILLFFSTLSCQWDATSNNNWGVVPISDLHVELTLWLETAGEGDIHFGHIGNMRTDNEGNFYISDLISQSVKKLDRNGRFVQEIGKRGRGIGELMSIKSFNIVAGTNGFKNVIVTDNVSRQINFYSLEGSLVSTHRMPNGTEFPKGSFQTYIDNNTHNHLFLYKLHERAPGENCLFHRFKFDFSKKEACFGDFRELKYHRNDTFHYLSQVHPGHMVVDGDSTIYYTPRFYDGLIYKYTKESLEGEWKISGIISGLVYHTKPFAENKEPEDYHVSYKGQRFYGKLLNQSVGFFKTSDGLIHFTRITVPGGVTWFGAEKYNKEGEFQEYLRIRFSEFENDYKGLDVLHLDKDDYYYLVNNRKLPNIYRFRL